jgi:hypothetical protein
MCFIFGLRSAQTCRPFGCFGAAAAPGDAAAASMMAVPAEKCSTGSFHGPWFFVCTLTCPTSCVLVLLACAAVRACMYVCPRTPWRCRQAKAYMQCVVRVKRCACCESACLVRPLHGTWWGFQTQGKQEVGLFVLPLLSSKEGSTCACTAVQYISEGRAGLCPC